MATLCQGSTDIRSGYGETIVAFHELTLRFEDVVLNNWHATHFPVHTHIPVFDLPYVENSHLSREVES